MLFRWRVDVLAAPEIRDGVAASVLPDRIRTDHGLSVPARNVEDVGWLAQPRNPSAQARHKGTAFLDGEAEMARARRKIGMVQVVWLHPRLHEGAHEGGQRVGVVIDAS